MANTLVSGATEFIGSTLAGAILSSGHHVMRLSHNDPHGQRTQQNITEAMAGFGSRVTPNLLSYTLNRLIRITLRTISIDSPAGRMRSRPGIFSNTQTA